MQTEAMVIIQALLGFMAFVVIPLVIVYYLATLLLSDKKPKKVFAHFPINEMRPIWKEWSRMSNVVWCAQGTMVGWFLIDKRNPFQLSDGDVHLYTIGGGYSGRVSGFYLYSVEDLISYWRHKEETISGKLNYVSLLNKAGLFKLFPGLLSEVKDHIRVTSVKK